LPLYEYKCVKCAHRFEKIEKVNASETKKCPKCGAKAERQLAAPAIQFKGSGWYVTDYAGKNSASASGESGGDSGESKSSEKKTESKPAASDKKEKGSAAPAKKK
jgi:putative FmdB family regulatory protein